MQHDDCVKLFDHAERFIEEVSGDEPELAAKFRIEEPELVGGVN